MIFVVGVGKVEFNYVVFEVENFDDFMLGYIVLKDVGVQFVWGIGWYIYGFQIFDYWKDFWGFKFEYWMDGDFFMVDEFF